LKFSEDAQGTGPIVILPDTFLEDNARIAIMAVQAGKETKRYTLATIGSWPETKTECWSKNASGYPHLDLGFVLNIPRIYQRTCEKITFVDVTYPTGMVQDIEECVKGAALAAANSGRSIEWWRRFSATFEAALKGCLAAKGSDLLGRSSQCEYRN